MFMHIAHTKIYIIFIDEYENPILKYHRVLFKRSKNAAPFAPHPASFCRFEANKAFAFYRITFNTMKKRCDGMMT